MTQENSYRALLDHPLWLRLKNIPKNILWDIATSSIFINLLIAALPIFTRVIYDRVIPNFATDTLWVLCIGMVLVVLFDIFFKAARSWVTFYTSSKASSYIDQYSIKSLFHQKETKDFSKVHYYLSLAHEISQFYCTKLIPVLIDLTFVIVFFAIIYSLSPALTLVPFSCGVLIIATQIILISRFNHIKTQFQINQKERNHHLVELTSGFSTIKNLNIFKLFHKRWTLMAQKYSKQNFQFHFSHHLSGIFIQSIMMLNTVLIMVVGVYQINLVSLSTGALIAISILSSRILTPLVNIGEIIATLPKILHQKNEIEDFLGDEVTSDNAHHYKRTLKGTILLKDVSYKIKQNHIIKNCSLYIEANEKVALVGPSGAGKTTLLNLLSMEYSASQGCLFFDNHNSVHLNEYFTKNQISIVEQYPHFFERTLKENMSLGSNVTEDEIIIMLRQLGLYEAIFDTGYGLELPVSQGGSNFSGGQRQALAIIRAILRKPKIILMDEPTSMMDHLLEQKVIAFLKHHLANTTTILISHRSALLDLVGRIVVMKKGLIIKDGLRHDILKQFQEKQVS